MSKTVVCLVAMRKGNISRISNNLGIVGEPFKARFKRNSWAMPVNLEDLKRIAVGDLASYGVRVVDRPAEEWVVGQDNFAAWQLVQAGFTPEANPTEEE